MLFLLAAVETALLLQYFISSGTAISANDWLNSFGWHSVTSPFYLKSFLGVLLVSIGSIFAYLGWISIAWITGTSLLARIGPEEPEGAEKALISIGLGLGAISLLFFFLGLFHLFYPQTPYLLALTLLIFGAAALRRNRASAVSIFPKMLTDIRKWNEKTKDVEKTSLILIGSLCVAMLLFHLIGALLPAASFDELNYQLAIPKLYTLNHGFIPIPYNHLSFLPKNMNMLFVVGLLERNPVLCKLFSWGMGVLASLSIYFFGRSIVGRNAAFFSGAIFFLTPVIGNQFRVAGTDLGTGFYELLAVFLLLRWLKKPSSPSRELILSSIFWGFALGTKYSAIPGFAAGFLLLIYHLFNPSRTRLQRGGRQTPAALAAYLLPAALLCSPWLIQNWAYSGNPLNPLFSTILHSRNFYFAGEYKPLVDYAAGLGIQNYFPINSLRDVLRLPWALITQHNDFNHDLGAAWLLCVPLVFWPRRSRLPQPAKTAAALCAVYWAFWLLSKVRMARYFVAGIGLTSLLAGWLISVVFTFAPSASLLGAWAFLFPFLIALTQQSMRMIYIQNLYKTPWGYLAGRTTLKNYLENSQVNFSYDAFRFINQVTPPDATVLVFGEFRTLYLNRNFIASTPWDHDCWHELVKTSASPEEISAKLRERDITYFLVNEDYVLHQTGARLMDGWSQEDWIKGVRFWKYNTRRLFYDEHGTWVALVAPPLVPPEPVRRN